MAHLFRAYKYVRSVFLLLQDNVTETNISSANLLRRPMMTQCITAAVLFGTGDVIAQQGVEGKGRDHDAS